MRKEYILPLISAIILASVLILASVPETRNFLTGFVISQPEQYSLSGQIKITTPNEINDSCNILLSLQNQVSVKKQ